MSDYHNRRAKEIMAQIMYATVATSSKEAKPWSSPVAYFRDADLNLYWFSDKDSTHSRNIRQNENVFVVIYDSTMKEGTGEGLYIKGVAREIYDVGEVAEVAVLQTGSMRVAPEQCAGDAIHRFYKITPQRAWMNDDEKDADGNYVKDIRVEIPLEDIK